MFAACFGRLLQGPKHVLCFRHDDANARHTSTVPPRARIAAWKDWVWVPGDYFDLASRPAIDKTLQRLAASGDLRRIDRDPYDRQHEAAEEDVERIPGRETTAVTPTEPATPAADNCIPEAGRRLPLPVRPS